METVYSCEEAETWFIRHASGGVWAENGMGERKYLQSYPEAMQFFGKI